jgi:hypothetical protein
VWLYLLRLTGELQFFLPFLLKKVQLPPSKSQVALFTTTIDVKSATKGKATLVGVGCNKYLNGKFFLIVYRTFVLFIFLKTQLFINFDSDTMWYILVVVILISYNF